MADEPEDDELLLTEVEGEEPKAATEQDQDQQPKEGEEELEVLFGDEPAPGSGEGETGLVKHLREQLRSRDKELAGYRKAPAKIEVGEEPTLAGCNYDEEAFKEEWKSWNARSAQAKAQESEAEQTARTAREQWQREVQSYEAKKAQLKFADVEEVEGIATAALNQVQQAVIVKAADNPALVLYSLGKHPAKLAELSQITDPIRMAAAVARLEGGLKVMPRRRTPDPEEIASGDTGVRQGTDKELERLEREAEKNGGDRTAINRYKSQLRRKAA